MTFWGSSQLPVWQDAKRSARLSQCANGKWEATVKSYVLPEKHNASEVLNNA